MKNPWRVRHHGVPQELRGDGSTHVYALPGAFSNQGLHNNHSLEGRSIRSSRSGVVSPRTIACWMPSAAAHYEHGIGVPDQSMRSNMVLAGEDPVRHRLFGGHHHGFPADGHRVLTWPRSAQMGSRTSAARMWPAMTRRASPATGPSPRLVRTLQPAVLLTRRVGRYQDWAASPRPPTRCTSPSGSLPPQMPPLQVRRAGDSRREPQAFLSVGAHGRLTAFLNGEKVMESRPQRYRIAQFQKPSSCAPRKPAGI